MSEKKISELVSLTGADAATGDLLPIVDVDATETKKITREEFFKNIPSATISGNLTVDNAGASSLVSVQAGIPGSVSGDPKLEFIGATSASGVAGYANIYMDVPSGGKSDMYFQTAASGGSGGQANRIKINGNGDISFYEDTGTTPKFFWDASTESLGIGNAAPATALDVTGTITSDGLTVQSGIADIRAGNIGPSANPAVNIGREDTSITGGNPLGYVQFLGSDNTAGSLTPHAYIGALASGTHTAGSNPTELVFGTTAGSSETIVDRMLISSGGDISFYEDTGTTPKFFWDASAEALGIGTTSPSGLLHLAANTAATTAPAIVLQDTGTTATRLGTLTNDGGDLVLAMTSSLTDLRSAVTLFDDRKITFTTNNAERMRIDSSGNVGIGTSSPSSYPVAPELVVDTGTNGGITIKSGTSNYGGIYFADGTTGDEQYRGFFQYNHNYAGITDSLLFGTSGLIRMRIDSSGNVGIGTSPPSATLTVGAPNASAVSFVSNPVASFGGGVAFDAGSGNDIQLINYRTSNMQFGNGGSVDMTIDSSGNVGIGTSSPSSRLHVVGTSSNGYAFVSDGTGSILIGGSGAVTGGGVTGNNGAIRTAGNLVFTTGGAAERMRIDASGNLLVGKTAIGSTTDGFEARASGFTAVSDTDAAPFNVNRNGTDGDLVYFYKGGTTVGSIGANTGYLYIGSPVGNDAYMWMGDDVIAPSTSGGNNRDNAIDLGTSSNRWKNLYLSGGVYLGGTTSANLLDDYEEGTFTVQAFDAATGGNGSANTATGYYTKVGRMVVATGNLSNVDTTGMTAGNILYLTLPFSIGTTAVGSVRLYANVDNTTVSLAVFGSSSAARLNIQQSRDENTLNQVDVGDLISGSSDLTYTITYQV